MKTLLGLMLALLISGCSKPKPDHSAAIAKLAAIEAAASTGTTFERMSQLVADFRAEITVHPIPQDPFVGILYSYVEMWRKLEVKRDGFLARGMSDPMMIDPHYKDALDFALNGILDSAQRIRRSVMEEGGQA